MMILKISHAARLLALLFACCLFCACAKKPPTPPYTVWPEEDIADLREFPQNLEVYAKEAGANKPLFALGAQENLNSSFDNIWFGPWSMRKTTIAKREVSGVFGKARGYKANNTPWSQQEWEAIRQNANLGAYPSAAKQAITLRQTNLREIPTHEPRYLKPAPDPGVGPFDYFQYSILPPGMPLLVAHTSKDGAWYYVECPIAGGWVAAADIATVDENFKHEWQSGRYMALIRDNVALPGTGIAGKDSKAGIGTILPLAKQGAAGGINVYIPKAGKNGFATLAEIQIKGQDAVIKPMAATPANVAKVGNAMMGQKYGWGGSLGNRDCSAMIRDLFTPFGIWLPRNSSGQAKRGHVIRLDGLTAQQKADAILANGEPFLSLVGLPGHITLYVGRWKNKPAIFHNVWGLRIIKDGNDDERLILGRAVVTSITPGMELENLYRPRTFVDRIRSLNTPGK